MQERIYEYGYILILDEVLEVIQQIPVSKSDQQMLEETGKLHVRDDLTVQWLDQSYKGKFEHLKRMANSKTLIRMEEGALMWIMPIKTLMSFPEIYVFTFMFDGSHMKHYLDLHGVTYRRMHIEGNELCEGAQNLTQEKARIRALIEIYEGPMNLIGERPGALSKSWWEKAGRNGHLQAIKGDLRRYFRYQCTAGSTDVMWSSFKAEQKRLAVKGYAKGFCPCNARATNEYRGRKYLAYLLNVYEQPYVIKWFSQRGIHIDQDAFALSQLLQWIWRSAIRDGEAIRLYLPSKRMRN